MALKFTKVTKAAAQPQTIPLSVADMGEASIEETLLTPLQVQIDEVGKLQELAEPILAQIAKDQERLKPLADATKKLQEMINDHEADQDQPLEIGAALYRLEAGLVGKAREIIDLEKVKKMLGNETFMKLASVKLGDLDKYLTPPQLEQVLKTNRTKRTIKVIRKAS